MRQEHTEQPQNTMNIQWYPGHMTKTRRMIEADVKLVDAVCEILDARIPLASRNPDIDAVCGCKPRMVVLNRIDMADPAMTKRWAEAFRAQGYAVEQEEFKPGLRSISAPIRNAAGEVVYALGCIGLGHPGYNDDPAESAQSLCTAALAISRQIGYRGA